MQTSKDGHVRHVCFRCLNTFKTEKSLASHHEYGKSHEAIKFELPEKGSKISFKNHKRSMRVPFIVYADFESFTPQLSTCQPNPNESQAVTETHPQRILLPHKVFWRYTLFSRTSYFCKRIWVWRCCSNIYRHTWKEYQRHL